MTQSVAILQNPIGCNAPGPVREKALADYEIIRQQAALLPVKVSSFYQRKTEEEVATLGHYEGPLNRAVYPTTERITLRVPGETADFVVDRSNMPGGDSGIIQKYPDRVLFLPTHECISNCQYCFRQDVLHETRQKKESVSARTTRLIEYLSERPQISEVILSGGDPMVLPADTLAEIFDRIRNETSVRHIRLHTRSIIFSPQMFSRKKIEILSRYGVRIVFHIIHPYEICGDVSTAVLNLHTAGVRCYNQFPMLRGINDHSEVISRLLVRLDELYVRNLSVFVPEPVYYSAAFRIPLARIFRIMDEVSFNTPSWVHTTRLMLDSPYGKVRRDQIISADPATGLFRFERNGKFIDYIDFPAEADRPGDLSVLLWKDKRITRQKQSD